jgi:hypothetical protein
LRDGEKEFSNLRYVSSVHVPLFPYYLFHRSGVTRISTLRSDPGLLRGSPESSRSPVQ